MIEGTPDIGQRLVKEPARRSCQHLDRFHKFSRVVEFGGKKLQTWLFTRPNFLSCKNRIQAFKK